MRRIPLLVALLVPATASAHFHLDAPPAEWTQTSVGDPQKNAPCGPVVGGGTATGSVTTVMSGSSLAVTITETVTHPGHYRVSIAQDEAGLPAEPTVTPGTTACGSVPIDANPTLPVLADGVFQHTSAFSGPQSTQIQLPAGMTCTNCVVQVLEFMSNHAAPCFYHHCAIVSVVNGPVGDVGTDPGANDGGCNCNTGGDVAPGSALVGLFVGALVLRRRRR